MLLRRNQSPNKRKFVCRQSLEKTARAIRLTSHMCAFDTSNSMEEARRTYESPMQEKSRRRLTGRRQVILDLPIHLLRSLFRERIIRTCSTFSELMRILHNTQKKRAPNDVYLLALCPRTNSPPRPDRTGSRMSLRPTRGTICWTICFYSSNPV